ncbi:MAG: D-alanyl-D-alanine carboxypeptidase [Tenericutes bacterium]|nr:D-alanyl-D-alanine carboxypeptidase [Mycoplasmatota bacterium]
MEKKICSIFILFFLFTSSIFGSELSLNSDKYILYNMNDDKVLLEEKSHEKSYIASLTKMMSVLVSIENIESYDKKILLTNEMFSDIEWDVSIAGFKVGDYVTYNDLLYGAMLPSGADAVNSLAISISGNLNKFVKLMNEKAKELNMKDTNFANVTGLFDKNNYSTAYDISLLLKYALKNEKFKEVFSAKKYTSTNNIRMSSTLIYYNNKINENISYITGSKTGYIDEGGYSLASTATINNVDYLLVTLNAPGKTSSEHVKDAVNTYQFYSKNYSYQNIVDKEDVVVTLNTKYAKEKTIDIYSNETIDYYLKNNFDKDKIIYEYNGINELSYFDKIGKSLGTITIKYEDEVLKTFDLVYSSTLTFSLFNFLWINKLFVLIVIMLIMITIILSKKKKKKRKIKITRYR